MAQVHHQRMRELLADHTVSQANGHLVGMLGREDVINYLRTLEELGE